ncbi:MAG: hypothetical protein JWN76_301 [Chitinophagaceae bacterium]|nr:hypothetical protein [Chitinophagaceae bacterium]
MRKILLSSIILSIAFSSYSQAPLKQRIKLFVDCPNAYCDISYIKTEINFVDFVLDNKAADVHALITQQNNGGGGSAYQLIFFGQNSFKDQSDTLRFNTKATNTDFEVRAMLSKYLQLGLIPFVSKTTSIENISFQMKENTSGDSAVKPAVTKDPWNYWVFRISTNGNINADKVYKGFRYSGNFSVNRITDKLKVSFNFNFSKNKNSYEFDDGSGGIDKIEVNNENYYLSHQIVKSLTDHWSVGYDVNASRSTFNNYKFLGVFKPAIEYNVFPYKSVNTKLLTIRYGVDVSESHYFDTTLYDQTRQTLFGQGVDVALTYNQKWGTINMSGNYHSYLNNPKYYNVGMGGGVNIRVTGGLSFNVYVFGSILRDQLYLPKGQATSQDILTRQRQISTNYNLYSFFGISYRFGSKLNNFVNPRFEGGGGNFYF